MVTTLDIIRDLCREHGITLAKLEKELGYGNGYLGKTSNISFERIIEIANYFGMPTDYFIPGESIQNPQGYYVDKKTEELAQRMLENPELRALCDAADGVPKNVLVSVYNLLVTMKRNETGAD